MIVKSEALGQKLFVEITSLILSTKSKHPPLLLKALLSSPQITMGTARMRDK